MRIGLGREEQGWKVLKDRKGIKLVFLEMHAF